MVADTETLYDILNDRLRQLHVAIPGKISSYDASTRKAEVEPMIEEKYADGQTVALPRIPGVPVVMPATGTSGLVLPVKSGDPVLLLFSHRSLDRWKSTGNRQDPGDTRMHALSDAIAIAGLFPFSTTHTDGSGLRLFNGLMNLRMDGGKVAIGTSVVELLDEITKALDEIVSLSGTWGAPTVQVNLSSAAIKTIKGSAT
jgi:hypothetical protein